MLITKIYLQIFMKHKICMFVLALLALHPGKAFGGDVPLRPTVAMQQPKEKTVSGVVSDDMGPVVGATVRVKGTTTGVVTNMDGEFTLKIPIGSTLLISFIGYQDKEIVYNGEANLTIHLSEDVTTLDEVQVIAYGTTKKVTVTGAMSSVKTEE